MINRVLPILLIFIGLSTSALAEPVKEITAEKVANNFFKTLKLENNSPLQLIYKKNDAYYVYGNQGSFVVIAAEDAAKPILAYSTESTFVPQQAGDTSYANNYLGY